MTTMDAPDEGWWLASDGRWYPPQQRPNGLAPGTPVSPVAEVGARRLVAVADAEDRWLGRTRYDGDLADLRDELAAAEQRPESSLAANFLEEWLTEVELDTVQGKLDPIRPERVPPLPMPLLLPAERNVCPIESLEPWWNQIVLPAGKVAPIAEAPVGFDLDYRTRPLHGGSSRRQQMSRIGDDVTGHLEVIDGAVVVWGQRKLTQQRVKGPGLVGSFVPLYAEGRALASGLSSQSRTYTYGSRIPLAWVNSVTLQVWHAISPALLGVSREDKEFFSQRGYAQAQRFAISLGLCDTWRLHTVTLWGWGQPVADEHVPIEFAQWLVKWIAHHRSVVEDLDNEDRIRMDALATGAEGLEYSEKVGRSDHVKSWNVTFPKPRPISTRIKL